MRMDACRIRRKTITHGVTDDSNFLLMLTETVNNEASFEIVTVADLRGDLGARAPLAQTLIIFISLYVNFL